MRKVDRPIQIQEGVAFQVRMSRLQAAGQWLFFCVLVAALAGAAGGGAFSRATAGDAEGQAFLRFDRFARAMAPQTIELQIRGESSDADVDVSLNGEFLDRTRIESIVPEPDQQSASGTGVHLRFLLQPSSESGQILIRYRPLKPGFLRAQIGVGNTATSFSQFVYP